MQRRCGADVAEAVGAGRGQPGYAACFQRLQNGLCRRVRRAAQADGGMLSGCGVGHIGPARHDHGEWPGPEGLHQRGGMVGQLLQKAFCGKVLGRSGIGHVHDERVPHRAAFGGVDARHGLVVVGAGGQAVNGFGRQAQQAALGKDVGRLFDGGGVGCGK